MTSQTKKEYKPSFILLPFKYKIYMIIREILLWLIKPFHKLGNHCTDELNKYWYKK